MHVGILEDDEQQRELLELWLQTGRHTYASFGTTQAYLESLKRERYDLLLVDWLLPDGTGTDVLRWVRESMGSSVPIVVVTAQDDENTVITALHAGADDYIVKPPKPMELLARIEAVARRSKHAAATQSMRLGHYEVDWTSHKLSLDGVAQNLTQKEFDLAAYFFQNPGKLLSRDHLLNKVWGLNADVDTRTVDTHVSRLRKKLQFDGSKGWKLSPIYGYGYRFDRVDA